MQEFLHNIIKVILVLGISCILAMIFAMWVKGDLEPKRLKKLINKLRRK